ncbi:lipopolysaccharide transport periplasmic protein LptA [Aromatoleum toluclasticum]|nr:lipopolysaccharide transport periplasmic protein LptA [Aromatoleum toluclasticum]MCC4115071.1 lipopolysaccharide transport periplasmic protein LptA [Aromatoleum toluclasticum]
MRTSLPTLLALAHALVLGLLSQPALAERADRDQPVNIEANRVTVDDRNKVHVFEGDVVLTQGTLVIKGAKLVVTQGPDGFQSGVATGSEKRLATFRQKREGSTEYVDGEAERIEYDGRAERARLFNQAHVKSGADEVSGHYIEYDSLSENYLVTNQPGKTETRAAGDGRVRAVIQPKNSGPEKTK